VSAALGCDRPEVLGARANLASSYAQAGRTNDAIRTERRVVAGLERLRGDQHQDTVAAHANLAVS
jgi:hypothetical protein